MMKLKTVLLGTCFAMSCFAYNIDIRINGIKDTTIYLLRYYGDLTRLVDSTRIDDQGKGVFSHETSLPGGIYLFLLPGKKFFEVLIDENQDFRVETDTTDLLFKLNITGAPDSEAYLAHQKEIIKKQKMVTMLENAMTVIDANDKRRNDIIRKIEGQKKEMEEVHGLFLSKNAGTLAAKVVKATLPVKLPSFESNKDLLIWRESLNYYIYHYFDNIDLDDDRLLNTPILKDKFDNFFNKAIPQHPDSIIKMTGHVYSKIPKGSQIEKYLTSFLLYNYNQPSKQALEDVLYHISAKYLQTISSEGGQPKTIENIKLKTRYIEKILAGKTAPDLNLYSATGEETSLSSISSPYVVLMFWDPGCGHCQEEHEKLKQAYETHSGKFEVFAVYTGKDKRILQQAVETNNLTWANVYDPFDETGFKKTYQVYYTPKFYLLDGDKKIITKSNTASHIINAMEF